MKHLELYYSEIGNMGDLLNEILFGELFGVRVQANHHRYRCNATGIGSYLSTFFPARSKAPRGVCAAGGRALSMTIPLHIWSTGFIRYPKEDEIALRSNMRIKCVRGELTRERLSKILGRPLDIPTGDGGLLASELELGKNEKRYSLGVIPHFKERKEPAFAALAERYEHSVLIDLTEEPKAVLKKIAQCETVLSSSLHGLIVADSFRVPNRRLVLTDALLGDGYKFDDYYSAYGIQDAPVINLLKDEPPSVNQIIDGYAITDEAVKLKKKRLAESFLRG